MKKNLHTIILASTSPRRADLLNSIGVDFQVVPSNYEEDMTLPLSPEELPKKLSREKALSIAKNYPEAVIIGADTIVVIDNKPLGKAHTKDEARYMLNLLSGKTHRVITGVTVIIPPDIESTISVSEVTFRTLSADDIDWYISTGEPLEKAGGYAIQGHGAVFVEKIHGSYSGIVGLPLELLHTIFTRHNIKLSLS